VPVFSYVGRIPQYSLFGVGSYWAPPWEFFRATVETALVWSLKHSTENRARLTYRWDFYGLNEFDGLHTLRLGTHTIGVGRGLKRL
jgi:hypothetical protein